MRSWWNREGLGRLGLVASDAEPTGQAVLLGLDGRELSRELLDVGVQAQLGRIEIGQGGDELLADAGQVHQRGLVLLGLIAGHAAIEEEEQGDAAERQQKTSSIHMLTRVGCLWRTRMVSPPVVSQSRCSAGFSTTGSHIELESGITVSRWARGNSADSQRGTSAAAACATAMGGSTSTPVRSAECCVEGLGQPGQPAGVVGQPHRPRRHSSVLGTGADRGPLPPRPRARAAQWASRSSGCWATSWYQ